MHKGGHRMRLKTLQVGEDLREHISYGSHAIPLTTCIDNFDDYLHREWGFHWHDELEFAVLQKGVLQFRIYNGPNQVLRELHQGDGIIINSGYLHSAKAFVPDTVIAELALPITFFNKPFESAAHQIVCPVTESETADIVLRSAEQADQPLLSGIQEICSITEQETGFELHFVELVCKIWRLLTIRILQGQKTNPVPIGNRLQEQRVKQIISFIHSRYSEHISIDDMARFATISRTECFRCFQAFLGKSPVEYLTEYRLSMAAMLLANTDRSLADISHSCGFSSPSYFGKLFREQGGVTPKKYREQVQYRNDQI